VLPPPVVEFSKQPFQAVLGARQLRLTPGPLALWQLVELLRQDDLAVPQRSHREQVLLPDDPHADLLGLLLGGSKGLVLPLLEPTHQLSAARAILFPLQRCAHGHSKLGHRGVQVGAQRCRSPGGQGQCVRTMWVVEIVDVAPVLAGQFFRRAIAQELPQDALLAHARGADHKQVVAVPAHRDAETGGLDGLVLPHEVLDPRIAGRRLEGQTGWITAATQRVGRQNSNGTHGPGSYNRPRSRWQGRTPGRPMAAPRPQLGRGHPCWCGPC
jgi:hypothetical protein